MELGTLERDVRELVGAGRPRDAADRVVRGIGPDVLGYLHAVLRNEDDAREAFAQVNAQLLLALPRFRAEGSLKSFVYRMAFRAAMRLRRTRLRARTRPLRTHEASELAEPLAASTAPYRRTSSRAWLEAVRASLSPLDQSLLTLRVDRGLSWDEVAHVMGLAGGSDETARLRKRFERIKDRLRQRAERDGILG